MADAAGQAGSIQISRPSNAVAAVKKLDEIAFPRAETAYCLASWGLDHPSSSADLANALVETVSALPPEVANNVAEFLFRHEPRSNEFLQSLVGALHGSPRATPMLQALVDRFGMRFRPPREDPLYFSAPISSDTTKSIADAARALAKILAVSASEVVQRAAQREKVEAELVPLSPFRRLPAADSADVALGWILLWDLLASVGPTKSDGTAELPDEVFGRVKAYLATKRVGVSTNVRELLTRIVGF
ncbi:MAG TPA: hypothetical protein VJV79_07545 [Polyangiaceae bacterium]|nr:hypothetical protein [Polyangiaceae bacterium]